MAADMVYPALFGYTCFRLTGLLLAGTRLQAILKKRLLPLPVVSAVLDYLEEFCLIAVVSACPEALQIDAAAPFFYRCQICGGLGVGGGFRCICVLRRTCISCQKQEQISGVKNTVLRAFH